MCYRAGILSGLLLIVMAASGCSETTRNARSGSDWWRMAAQPDELPQILNHELPFRYPLSEYMRMIEGNVTLRLHVDTSGHVVPDSTTVVESSGHKALDDAAVSGATRLEFKPARRTGKPMAVSLIFPVHFRHPDRAGDVRSKKDSTDFRPIR